LAEEEEAFVLCAAVTPAKLDSVLGLPVEDSFVVVNNQHFLCGSPDSGEVLYPDLILLR